MTNPRAFAVVREGAKRVLGMEHYRVQIIGGIILHQGRIAEMKTGEGKTLVSTLPAYLNALEGKGVHIVTVNDYLAKRDAEWMGKVHEFLGLTVGVVLNDMKPEERRAAYGCDITYVTNNELECDRRKRFTLSFDLNMFFCFDCLMKSVRITTSRHDTSGKFINDQNLVIFYNIILVFVHQIMCTKCQCDVMLDFQVLRISQIVQMEELLYLLHTIFCQVDVLFLLIYDKVSGFLNLFSHDGVDLRELSAGFTFFHLSCKNVTCKGET